MASEQTVLTTAAAMANPSARLDYKLNNSVTLDSNGEADTYMDSPFSTQVADPLYMVQKHDDYDIWQINENSEDVQFAIRNGPASTTVTFDVIRLGTRTF